MGIGQIPVTYLSCHSRCGVQLHISSGIRKNQKFAAYFSRPVLRPNNEWLDFEMKHGLLV